MIEKKAVKMMLPTMTIGVNQLYGYGRLILYENEDDILESRTSDFVI